MVKVVGIIVTFIGAVMSVINAGKFMHTSHEIQAWYYYKAQLESYRTSLFVGIVITFIGVVILLTSYIKNKNS